MTNEILKLLAPFCAGVFLGAIFFGGLWWTIRMGLVSSQPALWFLGSLLFRMSVALLGFYYISGGDWRRLLVCLLGFAMTRFGVAGLTATPGQIHAT